MYYGEIDMRKFNGSLVAAVGLMGMLPLTASVAATLEEVVVTAQKRSQSVQDIPITVNAISGETLSDFGVDNLFKLADLVPGMVFSRAPDDGLALTLRGLGTPARTQSFDQSVALFLDGMFLGKGRMYSSAFFDVERVEVIKGTQSTLLGKNTSLGALSLTTTKPGQEFGGNIQVSGEFENGGWAADGGIDIPVSDTFAVRLAGHYVDQDGWVENVLTGEDVPADEDLGLRATAVYTPTDALNFTFTYQNSDSERTGNGFQFIDKGGYFSPEVLDIIGEAKLDDKKSAICVECPGGESFHDTEVDLAGLTIEWDIGGLTLTSVTAYAGYDMHFYDDFDFGDAFDEVTYVILNPGTVERYSTYFEREEDYDQFSQELRFASDAGGKLEYMGGLFYFDSSWDSSEAQYFSTPNFPPVGPTGQIFNGPFTNNFDQDTETWSVFGQVTLQFTDRFRGTLGLRYTDEQKDIDFQRVQGDPATLWNSVINPPFDSALSFDDDFLNGNLNVQFDASDDIMLYASYGLGSKTGGYAESAEVGSGDPSLSVEDGGARVETEEAQTYEIGAKMMLLDGSATLNVALFYTEVEDFQETSFLVTDAGAQFLTRNIDVEAEGVEFDGQWQLTDSLRLMGGATYADTTHTDDNSKLAQAPEWTGNIGALFETQITEGMVFSTSGFVRYRDDMVSQINETFPSDSMTSLDLNFSLIDIDNVWKVSLIATNVTDEVVTDFSGPPAAPVGALFGAPPGDQGITADSPSALRTIRLQVGYNF
jgi:iron complex outermembrane receptor protein